jgi:hypothetical protein
MEKQLDLAAAGELAHLAEEFCRLIDEREQHSAVRLLKRVHPLLPRLYSAGLALAAHQDDPPGESAEEFEEESEDEEDEDEAYAMKVLVRERSKDRPDREHWWMLFRSLGAQLGQVDTYAEVFDPYREPPEEAVTGTLSDDLAGIYHDLAEGLAKWRRGEQADAAERWRQLFEIHWSEHVTGALRAIRTLAYSYDWDLSRYQA